MQCCILFADHDNKAVRAFDGNFAFCLYHLAVIVARQEEVRLIAHGG